MGLFDFIKSIFGKDESTRERVDETNVSVEREPDSEGVSETESREDIGETESGEDISESKSGEAVDETERDDEPIAEPTDATGSTESILDDDAASEPATAFEPAEAVGPEAEDMSTDVEGTGPEPGNEGIDETEREEKFDEAENGEAIDEAESGEEIDEAEGDDEPVAEPTDASGSTEAILDDDAANEPATAFEPSEATAPEPEDMSTDVEETGPESGSSGPAGEGPSVREIKGIGSAYSERLDEAGVGTVADLADADAADLAERTGVSESRVQEWIDRARDFEE